MKGELLSSQVQIIQGKASILSRHEQHAFFLNSPILICSKD
ncbi:hypothetical protein Leryth_005075 [Lithospermum erythrorhizon]|nr:hypothetical protein Leryth_005075 [Lithospermum erythrorhizon]